MNRDCEVLIGGGGMVGFLLAIALAKAGIETILVDRETPADQDRAEYDGRASALALGSQQFLEKLGLWAGMAGAASPILDIRVADGAWSQGGESRFFVHYDHRDLPEARPFGWIVENRIIRRALAAALPDLPRLRLIAPARIVGMARETIGRSISLADGRSLGARLVVASDGRQSALRGFAGIAARRFDYKHDAIVLTVAHEKPHRDVAHEIFLPAGPFAMLPMTDEILPQGGLRHRSSIVWTEERALIPWLLGLDDAALGREIARRFGASLGALSPLGPRFSYPLQLSLADRYGEDGFVLVGDAAHGIHPVAGQGFNLGVRDAEALAQTLIEAHRLGLDIGSLATLDPYIRRRRFDNLLMAGFTDSLVRLFSNESASLRLARNLGFFAFDRLKPLKRFAMRYAMGIPLGG